MSELSTAFEKIKETYDLETLTEIRDHGCASGVAHDHIYYTDTIAFFDKYEDEITEHIADTLGDQFRTELWDDNPCNITGYKNDTVWCYIELIASQLVDEHEGIKNQEGDPS